MKLVPFIAENAVAALTRIHKELGPDAVVVSVRPVSPPGLARFWQRSRSVEVLACVAEDPNQNDLSLCQNQPFVKPLLNASRASGSARVAPALHDGAGRPHVFVGPPGVGKTTLLCKWLAMAVLNENRKAKVLRLDGSCANTAEFLNVYGEMLGVHLERFCDPVPGPADLLLVDLPGTNSGDAEGFRALKQQLNSLPSPRVHLVLNAAYETNILNEQFRTFAPFEPEDLSFSHLDEEKRQGKLLDFILGTNCCIRFLSTGQKIPGDFVLADAAPLA